MVSVLGPLFLPRVDTRSALSWESLTARPNGAAAWRSATACQPRAFFYYEGLKSKVGLAAAKAAALGINLHIAGCGVVAPPVHAPSRAPLLLPILISHNLPFPHVH